MRGGKYGAINLLTSAPEMPLKGKPNEYSKHTIFSDVLSVTYPDRTGDTITITPALAYTVTQNLKRRTHVSTWKTGDGIVSFYMDQAMQAAMNKKNKYTVEALKREAEGEGFTREELSMDFLGDTSSIIVVPLSLSTILKNDETIHWTAEWTRALLDQTRDGKQPPSKLDQGDDDEEFGDFENAQPVDGDNNDEESGDFVESTERW